VPGLSKNKLKIFNDPIYGFITIPNALIFDLIEHKYFQRLRRISQMGLSYLVYPGAHHTRFHHALGSMHLMQKAIQVLRFKGVSINEDEENGLLIAILLHDIGHGPFSHAMEHSIVHEVSHEVISLKFMYLLNEEFNGSLTTAIHIFNATYPRQFMCQLISGQLDMDRADYLKRDSFYTGVAEGNINSERLITMLNVVNEKLVIEEKGIYSVEKFLIARRFMYWQVYLHKTGLVAEQLLTKILKRAKYLVDKGIHTPCSDALSYFLRQEINATSFNHETLYTFAKLDDIDILAAIKTWQFHNDTVLSWLCRMIINRDLLKIKLKNNPIEDEDVQYYTDKLLISSDILPSEVDYFVFTGEITNQAYQGASQTIDILMKNGKVKDIVKVSDHLNIKALSKPITKYFICYPKNTL
jgi:HD superfamily phosphohydrolase